MLNVYITIFYNTYGSEFMHSIGIDLIKHTRFNSLKEDNKFMNDIFNEDELNYINKTNYALTTIAGIYSAKEAFLKAIKKGINNYSLKDIEIIHDSNNAPYIILHNELEMIYKNYNISLSISHDGDYTTSIVLIEIN